MLRHQHTRGPQLSHPDIVAILRRLPQRRRREPIRPTEPNKSSETDASSAIVPRWKEREHALRSDLKDLSRALTVLKSDIWEICETGDAAVVKPVHWTLACLERCVEKMGKHFDDPAHDPTLRIFALQTINATQLHPLWRAWFIASRNHIPKLISATDVWNKILFMSRMVKGLKLLDTVAFSRIMQTAMQQVSEDRAPWIAEDMIRNWRNLEVDGGINRCTRTIVIYNQVLQAWTKSGHEEAAKRIHALLIVLKQKRIKKSTITYKILLRYFARLGDCTRLAVIWKEMLQLQDFVIDLSHRSQMVYGYSKMGNIDQAENFLYQMMECRNPKDVQDSILLVESIHVLLKAYRKTLENDVSGEAQRMIHHRLIRLKENVQRQHLLNKSIQTTILDIQSKIVSQDCVAFEEPDNMDAVQLSVILKNYGNRNLPHAATKLFLKRYTRGFDVDVHAFNTILNVWSESSEHDALQKAFDIFSRLLTDSTSKQRGLFPDAVTLSVMMKCISKSTSKQVGKILIRIIDLLAQRNSETSEENRITLDVVLCNVAIKACLDSDDWETANIILQSMIATTSLASPDIRTYNTLLSFLARKGTESASQQAKSIYFDMLKSSSSDSNLSLRPNLFSYNLVFKAMCSTSAVKASEEIWKIWANMENDESITPNNTTFKILLAFFSQSDDPIFLRRADHLLQSMLTCSTKNHQLRLNQSHFTPIVRGWIRDGNMEKAKSVLLQLTNLHIERKNPSKPPNPTIFFRTLQGFVEKGELIKAFELASIVQELMEEGSLDSGFHTKARDFLIRSWEKSNHPERKFYIDKLRSNIKFIDKT